MRACSVCPCFLARKRVRWTRFNDTRRNTRNKWNKEVSGEICRGFFVNQGTPLPRTKLVGWLRMSTVMKLTVPYHVASQLPPFAEGGAAFIRRNRSGCSGIWLRRHHLRQKIICPVRLEFKTILLPRATCTRLLKRTGDQEYRHFLKFAELFRYNFRQRRA